MPINPENIKHILIVRNDRFGEFLLNIPALRAVKETYPKAKITLVVNAHTEELIKAIPFVDDCFVWAGTRHSFLEKMKLVFTLKKMNLDMAIMLNPSKDFNIAAYLCGIPLRVGYDRKCGILLTHKIKDLKYLALKHEVEYNLDLVGLIGARTQNRALSLEINGAIIQSLDEKFGMDFAQFAVVVHPWTSDEVKQWPLIYFQNLVKRLTQELGAKVIVIGGKEESERSAKYFAGYGDRLVNLTGKTSLLELAALLKRCKLLISGDSGPVHLASCVGTPAVVLFRNDLPGKGPRRWGPWGAGQQIIEKDKLEAITVSEVIEKVRGII